MDAAAAEALASAAGNAVVAAAATDMFEDAKHRVARLFGRGRPDAGAGAGDKLAATRTDLTTTTGPDLKQARAVQAAAWRGRFELLLAEHPPAEAELRALVEEIQRRVPTEARDHSVAAGRDMMVMADRGGVAAGVLHGDVTPPGGPFRAGLGGLLTGPEDPPAVRAAGAAGVGGIGAGAVVAFEGGVAVGAIHAAPWPRVPRRPVRLRPRPGLLLGRDDLLADLYARLAEERPWPRVVVLSGPGGVGKSVVAVEYAHRHLAEAGLVWQLPADDRAVLVAGMAELAAQLGDRELADPRDPVASAHAVLAEFPGRWLLVFDNAPDEDMVRQFLPPAGHGWVVVTSRNAHWQTGQVLPVPPLEAGLAAVFLASRTGDTDLAGAAELASDLGGLPLALEQAAAYVQETGMTLAGYLRLFRARRARLHDRGKETGYPVSVAATMGLPTTPILWAHGAELPTHFTGRAEQLAQLDRWAADREVQLIGVTAWGGAGKTALVNHWATRHGRPPGRAGILGIFGWSFYHDANAEHFAASLLGWSEDQFAVRVEGDRLASRILELLRTVPLLLVLDGLEVIQEGLAGTSFGRLLDGTLREVLDGACWARHASFVVLTSRFPFADLESYDGSSVRILDVPALTVSEGAALLASAGAEWLEESARRELVEAADGHALAVEILALALADRPATSSISRLQKELTAAAHTSDRVSRVMKFYARGLSKQDQYIVAAVSLFARSVTAEVIASLVVHKPFQMHFDGLTAITLADAVRTRLSGLIVRHPDETLSAHPLVAAYFRPLAAGAAQIAGEISLTGIPRQVNSREAALRVVEVVELLLEAGQWHKADQIYGNRFEDGEAWATLPAPRLGQRAASGFVATEAKRVACLGKLGPQRQTFYLGEVGLYASLAGDLLTGKEYLTAQIAGLRRAGDRGSLAGCLGHLAYSLGLLGEVAAAREAAQEAADIACCERHLCFAYSYLGWIGSISGDSTVADYYFSEADAIQAEVDPDEDHLYGPRGIQWAEWLTRIGDTGWAWRLTDRNRDICLRQGWDRDAAGCEWMLGRIQLADGLAGPAGGWLEKAVTSFRASDSICDLAVGLTDLAECARLNGDLNTATRHAAEGVAIAAPRGMVGARSAGLTVKARICADRAAATSDRTELARGRDAADVALRLAERHGLAWHRLDAMRAHASLDKADGADRGWAERAQDLHAQLVPRSAAAK